MSKTIATIAFAAALALTGCSATSADQDGPDAQPTATSTAPAPSVPEWSPVNTDSDLTEPTETPDPADAEPPVRAVSLVETLSVTTQPGGGDVVAQLSARTDFGSARVLLVEEVVADHVRVSLPIRPNGTSGWVSADDVRVELIDAVVTVDLATRTATAWLGGDMVLTSDVAVGSPENPTPTGTFFVTDKIATEDDASAYGPFALGLSAHSDTLTEFAGGDGQIGLHGTDDPTSIGRAVSHGCVRFPNELISVLADVLPLGTPVVIS